MSAGGGRVGGTCSSACSDGAHSGVQAEASDAGGCVALVGASVISAAFGASAAESTSAEDMWNHKSLWATTTGRVAAAVDTAVVAAAAAATATATGPRVAFRCCAATCRATCGTCGGAARVVKHTMVWGLVEWKRMPSRARISNRSHRRSDQATPEEQSTGREGATVGKYRKARACAMARGIVPRHGEAARVQQAHAEGANQRLVLEHGGRPDCGGAGGPCTHRLRCRHARRSG